jgi:hypothetical protein
MNDSLSNLSNIYIRKSSIRKRVSSYDRTGGNADYVFIKAGEEISLCDIEGTGIVNHIWMTMRNHGNEPFYYRKLLIKVYYDDETDPSILAPIGDFFGLGHGITKNFQTMPLQMSPQNGRAFNCWWPMPFRKRIRINVLSECSSLSNIYYYIDYENVKELDKDALYLHAQFNRSTFRDVPPVSSYKNKLDFLGGATYNTTGKENYVILHAVGAGHYCGCNINIFNTSLDSQHDWIGEGDDMIFVDGEDYPPRLHGTGMEDYFSTAYCPTQEYCSDYYGLLLSEKENWKGRTTFYRYHVQDPVTFEKEIKVTIEMGHNNQRNDDYTSTAYWYQTEPHKSFGILPVEDRMPYDFDKLFYNGILEKVKS